MLPEKFDWNRYWCPRDSAYSLMDDGYLSDPEGGGYGRIFNKSLLSFGHIPDFPCTVLLGEPGIGKTNTMMDDYSNLGETHLSLFFNLGEYSNETRLLNDLNSHQNFKSWLKGDHSYSAPR